jgi:hypothetical protein
MQRGAARAVNAASTACSAALCPYGDRAAFRGLLAVSGRRAFRQDFDGLRRVEQRACPCFEWNYSANGVFALTIESL